jgi:hypothetical protein
MPHFFGLGKGKVSAKEEKRIQRIAQEYEATFFTYEENGNFRYWFSCQNKGEPFDSWTANSVMKEVGRVKTIAKKRSI